jgi:hypothetical protein
MSNIVIFYLFDKSLFLDNGRCGVPVKDTIIGIKNKKSQSNFNKNNVRVLLEIKNNKNKLKTLVS